MGLSWVLEVGMGYAGALRFSDGIEGEGLRIWVWVLGYGSD